MPKILVNGDRNDKMKVKGLNELLLLDLALALPLFCERRNAAPKAKSVSGESFNK